MVAELKRIGLAGNSESADFHNDDGSRAPGERHRCESAVPMTAKLALPRESRCRQVVRPIRPRPYDGPIRAILTPSAVTHNHSDAGSGRSSRTAGVNVGGLDRRVELHRIAALLARPIARALAAAERHVIVDAGRR